MTHKKDNSEDVTIYFSQINYCQSNYTNSLIIYFLSLTCVRNSSPLKFLLPPTQSHRRHRLLLFLLQISTSTIISSSSSSSVRMKNKKYDTWDDVYCVDVDTIGKKTMYSQSSLQHQIRWDRKEKEILQKCNASWRWRELVRQIWESSLPNVTPASRWQIISAQSWTC